VTINSFSSLLELATGLAQRQFTSVNLIEHYLKRIDQANDKLHAFVAVDRAGALHAARDADGRRATGSTLSVLDGLPIAVKDLFEIDGQVTTCGSEAWRDRRSGNTAAVVDKLRNHGMCILGKTHMVEYAFGLWGSNPLMGTPWNPWDLERHRIPGGSSSGSAVAVAAGLAPAAIGSDTGGSVRIPASLNGITGLKTTAGLISMCHALPLSSTLDTVGPMCRTVADSAWLTGALSGVDYSSQLTSGTDLSNVRIIALRQQDLSVDVQPDVWSAFLEAQRVLRSLGAQVIERDLPFDLTNLAARNGRLTAAEAWRIHGAYVEDPSIPIGRWVRARVVSGKLISVDQYVEDRADQLMQSAIWRQWLSDADALLTPTLPMVACALEDIDEHSTQLATFVRAANYLGACALSFPAGFSNDGLPISAQLIAKPFDEANVIRVGHAFQQRTDWHRHVPNVSVIVN